jgi:hypothetical protein
MKEIKDNQGHSIQMIELSKALYNDNGTKYIIGVEGLLGPKPDIVIYSNYIKTEDGLHFASLSDEKRNQIIETAVKLFTSSGLEVEIQEA